MCWMTCIQSTLFNSFTHVCFNLFFNTNELVNPLLDRDLADIINFLQLHFTYFYRFIQRTQDKRHVDFFAPFLLIR